MNKLVRDIVTYVYKQRNMYFVVVVEIESEKHKKGQLINFERKLFSLNF